MGWEVISKKRRSHVGHNLTITTTRIIMIGRNLLDKYLMNYNRVYLKWNPDALKIGIQRTKNDDSNTYRISRQKNGSVASISGSALLSYIKYKPKVSILYECEWNDKDEQLEITLNSDVIGKKRGRKVKRHVARQVSAH